MSTNELIRSCSRYIHYPYNLTHTQTTRPYVLKSLHDKLADDSARLFCRDGLAKLHLTRFHQARGTVLDGQFNDFRSLQLGMPCDVNSSQDLLVCQFAFVEAHSSRDVLDVSKEMMLWLLSLFQVMPNFLELVFPFGEQLYDYDFQFSAFRQDIRIGENPSRGSYPNFLRSGQDFQLCYNLKSIEPKPEDAWQWSARQAAIFNSFDVKTGQANWIIIKAKGNLRERLRETLRTAIRDNPRMFGDLSALFANTMKCHLAVVDWCAENWRWYIKYLEEQLETSTSRALLYKPANGLSKEESATHRTPSRPPQALVFSERSWTGLRINTSRSAPPTPIPLRPVTQLPTSVMIEYEEPDQLPPEFGVDDAASTAIGSKSAIQIDELQNAQYLESKVEEAALILKSNISIISSLSHHYEDMSAEIFRSPESLELSPAFKTTAQHHISTFVQNIRHVKADLESHLARIETIAKLATDRKTLLYSLVDYQNMQANEAFARKSQASAERMEDMTEDMQKLTRKTAVETVLMRIVTFVTVLFLPATFVSTMMSTNIIEFKPKDLSITSGTTSVGALKFFLCLTFTLMAATFGSGFGFYVREVSHGRVPAGPTGP